MINKNLYKKLGAFAVAAVLSVSIVVCGNTKEESTATSVSSVSEEKTSISKDSTSEAKTALTEKDISSFIKGMDDMTEESGTKDFDPLSSVTVDKNIIKGIKADTDKVNLDKDGKYTVTYTVVVDDDNYNAYKKDTSSYKGDFTKTVSLTKVDADATYVKIEKSLTVTAKDDKAAKTTTDSKTTSSVKTDNKTSNTTNKSNSSAAVTAVATTAHVTSSSAQNTAAFNTTNTTEQNSYPSDTSQNYDSDSETYESVNIHNWVAQTETVHHEAEYTYQWVKDSAAYDEPVYEEQPVYESVDKVKCNGCGEIFDRVETYFAHDDAKMEAGDYSHASWSVIWENVQTGTQKVQTGTVHHDATGHNEQVLAKAAYDETVVTGYVCSVCGARK